MARGIDLPEVHWVLQFDPPTTATSFIHRCGRTARCGEHGKAVLMVSDTELSYVDFLRINQKVELDEISPESFVSMGRLVSADFKSYTDDQLRKLVQAKAVRDKLIHYSIFIGSSIQDWSMKEACKHLCPTFSSIENTSATSCSR
ncbi:ATP-dependent RNA helicase ddx55 [Cichlidogyrus casuarinus]|uniref:ATP-dependent RNA helicase n=1 Tax=Cichlidogyrus casuarinus TaxID=1844966 RepID=A0ABD2QBW6_9PLAT